jgi:hypothetical protein
LQQTVASRFLDYKKQFIQMTKRQKVQTQADVETIIISNDEKHAIVIM